MTPTQAMTRYNNKQNQLRDEYQQYWIDKFAQAGLVFVADGALLAWAVAAAICGTGLYKIKLHVRPRWADGCYLDVYKVRSAPLPDYLHCAALKIISESGFAKFIRNIQRGLF